MFTHLQWFNPFALLFTAGFTFIGCFFTYKVYRWFAGVNSVDQKLILRGIFSCKTWQALGEVIKESLLHRKIFVRNKRLGYMHMSLAFGWFMLILLGNIESTWYTGKLFKPIYISVFWRFFDPGPTYPASLQSFGFAFWMDLFLLMVLSGLILVIIKRFHSIFLGMKQTTKQRAVDKIALTSLWLIFPARLVAESLTCGAHGTGGFLTGSLGNIYRLTLEPGISSGMLDSYALISWWVYSSILFVFFLALPFTRYAHIPAEPVLIFFRKYGVHVQPDSPGYSDLALHACSSCGICIDSCQLAEADPTRRIQSIYFLRSVRYKLLDDLAWQCLHCGNCEKDCPVGLELVSLRNLNRLDLGIGQWSNHEPIISSGTPTPRVLYYAGCMTHLTPSIKHAMQEIFEASGISWRFFDPEGGICCGRPLKLAGQTQAALNIQKRLEQEFIGSGATLLVTSCPICYRTFNEDYELPGIRILHHSQYIGDLIDWQKIDLSQLPLSFSYHEPCELRNISVTTNSSISLLSSIYRKNLTPKSKSLCCGGSLAGLGLDLSLRKCVSGNAMSELTIENPQVLVTNCPLCKKTFANVSKIPVLDLAESVASALHPTKHLQPVSKKYYPLPSKEKVGVMN